MVNEKTKRSFNPTNCGNYSDPTSETPVLNCVCPDGGVRDIPFKIEPNGTAFYQCCCCANVITDIKT